MGNVSREVAEAEVNKWLDFKKVSKAKREAHKDHIDTMAEAIEEGILVLNENNSFTHNLKFPIESEEITNSFTYKPRVKVSAIQMYMSGVKGSDVDGRLAALVAAVSGANREVIKAMDTEDYSVAQAIAIFFI